MKKFALIIASLVIFSSNAKAVGLVANPYIGLELNFSKYNFTTKNGINYGSVMPSSYISPGLIFGLDFHELLAFEFGYSSSKKTSSNAGGQYGIDSVTSAVTIMRYDAIFKLRPQGQDFTILGILGVLQGINSVETSGTLVNGSFKQGGYSFGYEYGIGFLKEYDERLFAKFEYRKQSITFGGIAEGGNVLTAGIGFRF